MTSTASSTLLPFQPETMTPNSRQSPTWPATPVRPIWPTHISSGVGSTGARPPGLTRSSVSASAHRALHPPPRPDRTHVLLGGHDDACRPRVLRFAHNDGLITADPAVYARLPKIYRDESRTQGLDRLELIRFLQVAQSLTVHHGALAFLMGINALRASEAALVRIEDYQETMRGYRVIRLVGKGNKPATMPITVPVLRVLEACRGDRTAGRLILRPQSGKPVDRRDVYRMVTRISKAAGIPRHISPHPCGTPPSPTPSTPASPSATPRSSPDMPTHAPPRTTTEPAATSTDMGSTS